ncbi:MAG: hypothetical protein RJB10_132, partial [Pseudomonadota bacterium]
GGVGFNPNVTSTPNGLGLGAYLQTNTNNVREVLTQEFRLTGTMDRLKVRLACKQDSRKNVPS